jgi:hypothetical protein
MKRAAEAEVGAAIEAEASVPPPPTRSIIEHVLAHPSGALEAQLDDLTRARGSNTVRS